MIREITKNDGSSFRKEWGKVAKRVVWNPKEFLFGAFSGDIIIGYSFFTINGGVGHLNELLVKERFRKRGFGKELLSHFEEFCKRKKCHKLTLTTSQDHVMARAFYRKNGYKIESRHPKDRNNLMWYILFKFLR